MHNKNGCKLYVCHFINARGLISIKESYKKKKMLVSHSFLLFTTGGRLEFKLLEY